MFGLAAIFDYAVDQTSAPELCCAHFASIYKITSNKIYVLFHL